MFVYCLILSALFVSLVEAGLFRVKVLDLAALAEEVTRCQQT